MHRDTLLALFAYNTQAHRQLLDAMAPLSEEQLARETPGQRSMRQLLQHTLMTEAFFLAACRERLFLRPSLPGVAEMRTSMEKVGQEIRSFLAEASEADLAREVHVHIGKQPFRFSPWQMLAQAFTHSVHHRGELGLMLGQAGQPVPNLDIIVQFAEEAGQPWPWK